MIKTPATIVTAVTVACERLVQNTNARQATFRAWLEGKPEITDRKCARHNWILGVNEWGSMLDSDWQTDPPGLNVRYNSCKECEVEKRLLTAGVPENMRHCGFGNFVPATKSQTLALKKAQEFSDPATVGFFTLASKVDDTDEGSFGIGKSHLAVAILRQWAYTSSSLLFITQSEFLTKLRRTYRDDDAPDIVALLKRVKLLVMDEVGVSVGGRDEGPTLHEIWNFRYGAKLKTVFTTNKSKEAFKQIIGPRMSDRMREAMFSYSEIDGKSGRPARKASYNKSIDRRAVS